MVLLPGSFSNWNGHGSWACIMFFKSPCILAVPNGPLSCYLEVCRMYCTEIRDFWWDRELWWAGDDRTMVLKTGSDWPVQPRTSVQFGSVLWKNRKLGKNGQKPETGGLTVKTANRTSWIGFGPVPVIPKLSRFCSFFLNLKPIFFIFSLPSSVLTPPLPFSLCLSVSHSHSHSHVLTSGSHGLTSGILVSISHSCGFSPHGLTSGVISPLRLTVSIFHCLTLVACDLTATACPQSLSPTNPAKGHGTPIKLSLSLSHSHCQILVYLLFFFFPIFSLWFGVYWVVGLLV